MSHEHGLYAVQGPCRERDILQTFQKHIYMCRNGAFETLIMYISDVSKLGIVLLAD